MDAPISDSQAIHAALSQNWKEAIRQNLALLKKDKNNISLLNRLGFAYLQQGQLTLAKKIFLKVQKIDPYNQIAEKNLKKLGLVRQKDLIKSKRTIAPPLSFLEEPGKTKIVECVNVAPFAALSAVCPGDEVELKTKNHVVEVRSPRHTYLGALPDDLSFRLIKFVAVGNTYQAVIQSVKKNSLTVFLRELSRGKRLANHPSFTSTAVYVPFTHTERNGESQNNDSSDEEDSDTES